MTMRTDDMLAIGQVMARYCRGIDRLDADLVAGVYWPDGYDDHGPFKGSGDEFVAWIMPAMEAMWSISSHILGQSHFEFRDDRAAVETLFTAHRTGRGDQAGVPSILGGRYLDVFEQRGGEWRILHRVVLYDWQSASTAQKLNFEHVEGHRSREDPSYHAFDLVKQG
jgi:ketosteroid isomerase-like protein